MDEESRVKEASAILHSMMTKGGRIKMPSHMQEESLHHSGGNGNTPITSAADAEPKQKQYVVLTNMQEPLQQSSNEHIIHHNSEMREADNEVEHQTATQIYVTPDIEEVMSESEEVERGSNAELKSEGKQMPRKKRKIADYLASGIDPTKLEESVAQVLHRFSLGCECIESNCFTSLNSDLVYRHRLNIAELTKAEQDMYLMGVTMASLTNPDETCRRKERQRLRAQYVFQGKKVCLDAFLYLENCTHYQLKRIRKHVMTHGVTPRIHGNHGKKPHNTFSLDIYKHAITYLENYILPYIPPAPAVKSNKVKNKKVIINLPAKITRKNIHNDYRDFCLNLNPPIKVMGYSSFRHFISEQFPNLRFSKPEKVVVPKFGPEAESSAATRGQYDSDTERPEDSGSHPTTIPLVMTSTNPDPTPSTFSSGGNTYVITQVLPAGFVPVNLSSCQMQGFPSMPDQPPSSNIVMAPTSTMSVPQNTSHSTYSFSNV